MLYSRQFPHIKLLIHLDVLSSDMFDIMEVYFALIDEFNTFLYLFHKPAYYFVASHPSSIPQSNKALFRFSFL